MVLSVDDFGDLVARGKVIATFMFTRWTFVDINEYVEVGRRIIVDSIIGAAYIAVCFMKDLLEADYIVSSQNMK